MGGSRPSEGGTSAQLGRHAGHPDYCSDKRTGDDEMTKALGFTAEASMAGRTGFGGVLRGRRRRRDGRPDRVLCAGGRHDLYCCQCMSGSDEPCCNPVASAPGGTSSPTGTTVITYLSR